MNTNPFGLKDNTTYSVKNDVVTEYVKPKPTPQTFAPPAVSSSAWIDALAESWTRRIDKHTLKGLTAYGKGYVDGMQTCLIQLRAHKRSGLTDKMSH